MQRNTLRPSLPRALAPLSPAHGIQFNKPAAETGGSATARWPSPWPLPGKGMSAGCAGWAPQQVPPRPAVGNSRGVAGRGRGRRRASRKNGLLQHRCCAALRCTALPCLAGADPPATRARTAHSSRAHHLHNPSALPPRCSTAPEAQGSTARASVCAVREHHISERKAGNAVTSSLPLTRGGLSAGLPLTQRWVRRDQVLPASASCWARRGKARQGETRAGMVRPGKARQMKVELLGIVVNR